MRSLSTLSGILALACTLVVVAPAARADVLELSDAELACFKTTINQTEAFVDSTFGARQDCFDAILDGDLDTDADCLAPAGETTGDPDIDDRLLRAEANLSQKISAKCFGVDMSVLGYPGPCDDLNGPPYDTFDHESCLASEVNRTINSLLGIEYARPEAGFSGDEVQCQKTIASKAAGMLIKEFNDRNSCVIKRQTGQLALAVDCRAEAERDAPATGHTNTDNGIVTAHNRILTGIASSCQAVNLENLGFPDECPAPQGSVYSLAELVECMFVPHNGEVFRLMDVVHPSGSRCGDGVVDDNEACDDGDRSHSAGEACLDNCTAARCGDTDGNGIRNVVDTLFVLRTAVGIFPCDLSVCDINGDGQILSSDAALLLQFSVGQPVILGCPPLSAN